MHRGACHIVGAQQNVFVLNQLLANLTHSTTCLRKNRNRSQVWQRRPIIPALRRWRQEDEEFIASMGCVARPCLLKPNNK
jgi:hypothetical protein